VSNFNESLRNGWALTRCSDFCSGRNQTFNPTKAGEEEFVLYSVPSHETGEPEIVRASEIGSNKQFVTAGDTLISKINPRLNRTWVVGRHPGKHIIASTEWIVFARSPAFIPEFLSYFLQQGIVRDFLSHNASGVGGSLTRVRASIFDEVSLPLPPLAEQKRIVAKIEELFSELEAGEASLRQARRQLGVYRQSLLKQAFEGKLTQRWRTQNPAKETAHDLFCRMQQQRLANRKGKAKSAEPVQPNAEFESSVPDGWLMVSMDALTHHITSGSRDWTKYYRTDGYAVFVMAQNVRPMKFDPTPVIRVSPPEFDRDKVRSAVASGDLLVTIVGANTGDVCRVDHELEDYYVCQSVALLRPVEPATSAYIELFMNSKDHGQKQFDQWMYGQGRPHLSFDQLRSTAICLPSLPEQQEIVRMLDEQFEAIERNERELDAALKRSEALRQSILKKAFTGRLVPQDPADEPASVLLERIRAEHNSSPPVSRISKRTKHSIT
jgi:type I restriction enzyme, S subunit